MMSETTEKKHASKFELVQRTRFTQVSLFSVLLSGRYDGVITIGELKKLGNMAIATMDRLDGEMQMIDGVVYQAGAEEADAETDLANARALGRRLVERARTRHG